MAKADKLIKAGKTTMIVGGSAFAAGFASLFVIGPIISKADEIDNQDLSNIPNYLKVGFISAASIATIGILGGIPTIAAGGITYTIGKIKQNKAK